MLFNSNALQLRLCTFAHIVAGEVCVLGARSSDPAGHGHNCIHTSGGSIVWNSFYLCEFVAIPFDMPQVNDLIYRICVACCCCCELTVCRCQCRLQIQYTLLCVSTAYVICCAAHFHSAAMALFVVFITHWHCSNCICVHCVAHGAYGCHTYTLAIGT